MASSDDREPFKGKAEKPAGPVYRFDDVPLAEAERGRQWLAELEKARKERSALTKTPMVYAGNFSQPGPTYRFHRGDPMQKREAVPPGTLAVFKPLTLETNAPEQQRRLQLADWIASPENPLTARVLVNRLWQHHFGFGLVTTPNDFGKNGAKPTNPELLDWLASEVVANGWSVKKLQRQILTSATWRQSSAPRDEALKVDAGSRLLWRFPPRRLEAEGIRDSILAVSGNLIARRAARAFSCTRWIERMFITTTRRKRSVPPSRAGWFMPSRCGWNRTASSARSIVRMAASSCPNAASRPRRCRR